MTTILVVEDDPALRRALRAILHARDYDVLEVETGEDGLRAVAEGRADLVLLDLGLPDMDGVDVLTGVRALGGLPVVVLTAHDLQGEKVRSLELGADDYVTKPFDADELLARIGATLRRVVPTEGPIQPVRVGEVTIDLAARAVRVGGEAIHLTRTELALLELLVRNPGKLLTREYLLHQVWGPGFARHGHYLRVYVGQLRKKLGDDAASPRLILTEPGLGYRWIGSEGVPG
jgi:two-component system KDP operon response regulator KdpE